MGMLPSMDEDELEDLEKQLNSAHLPDHALKVAQKELKVRAIYVGVAALICYGSHSDWVPCLSSFLSMLNPAPTWRHY